MSFRQSQPTACLLVGHNFFFSCAMIPLLAQVSRVVPNDDPHWLSVTAFLTLNGADQGTSFPDDSLVNATFSTEGAAKTVTAQSVYGGSSLYLDGVAAAISAPSNIAYSFGSGDFTIEGYIRLPSGSNLGVIAGVWHGTTGRSWVIFCTSNQLQFSYSTTGANSINKYFTSASFLTETWQHFAISRVGNTLYGFVDGVLAGTHDITGLTIADATLRPLSIGKEVVQDYLPLQAWMNYLRITKGVGRYSAAFNPNDISYFN